MKVTETVRARKYKVGYELRDEYWDDGSGEPILMKRQAYNPKGEWIGDSKDAHSLVVKRGIAPIKISKHEHSPCSIGFCEKEQKWYGWSHRAIYGFGVGATCEKGSCHYIADNPEEMIDDYANFFADISQKCADEHRLECSILPDRSGIMINKIGIEMPMANSHDELISAIEGNVSLGKEKILNGIIIEKCGKGEWTAKTLEDAKTMAIAFAESVS